MPYRYNPNTKPYLIRRYVEEFPDEEPPVSVKRTREAVLFYRRNGEVAARYTRQEATRRFGSERKGAKSTKKHP